MREGGCACGAVRFAITGDPIMVHNCHCRQCQQQTGSTSVSNAFFEGDRVTIVQGETSEYAVPGGSGRDHMIIRCKECGSAVGSNYGGLGKLMCGVRLGAMDDSSDLTPDVVIFAAEKMPWVTLPENIPSFEGYYRARDVLSARSVDRLRALQERRNAGEG